MIIYNLVIYLYAFLVRIASVGSPKAKLWINGRKSWEKKLASKINNEPNWIWFHCSSLGEFEDGRVLLESIKKAYPHYKILLSFFSSSGYEKQKNYKIADHVCYLPSDTPDNASKFVRILNPAMVFIVTNDIWVNYIHYLAKNKTPVFHISTIISSTSGFLKFPLNKVYRKAFPLFNHLFVQNAETMHILNTHFNLTNISITGDTRVDRVIEICNARLEMRNISQFVNGKFCVIGGSLSAKDEKIFLETIKKLKGLEVKWIIVPHEINQRKINKALEKAPDEIIAYSQISALKKSHTILWIDNIGMLSSLYQFADVAFIGGGFNRAGIHSIQEPASFGCPVVFGPNHRNYAEALDLIRLNGAKVIYNENELSSFINEFRNNRELLQTKKKRNREYIASTAGASNKILQQLKEQKYLN